MSQDQPLTLLSFTVDQWKVRMAPGEKETSDVVLHRLQAVVKKCAERGVRDGDSRTRGCLAGPCLKLPGTAAEDMAARVRNDFGALQVKVASYPEDGKLPEQLIRHLAA